MTERIALVGSNEAENAALQDLFAPEVVIERVPRTQARTLDGVFRWAARSLKSVERQPKHRAGLTAHLRDAIAENLLTVNYQAQFDLRSGLGIGVEALARWTPRDAAGVSGRGGTRRTTRCLAGHGLSAGPGLLAGPASACCRGVHAPRDTMGQTIKANNSSDPLAQWGPSCVLNKNPTCC
jgi:hypothetical protein